MSNICYTPTTGIDDILASKVSSWNKYIVSNLRGLYEERTGNKISLSDMDTEDKIKKEVAALISFRKTMSKEDSKKMRDVINDPKISYMQLLDTYTAAKRYARINMISTLFSKAVDAIQKGNPKLSREQIINGLPDKDGNQIGGSSKIFNFIYDLLSKRKADAENKGDKYSIDEYSEIFNNWGALVIMSKSIIKENEGLFIGHKIDFAEEDDSMKYGDNDIQNIYNMEESIREGWQQNSEFTSAFGSINKQVKKILSRIPIYKDNKPEFDDLGFPVMQSASTVHQKLKNILKGMSSSNDMINLLEDASKTNSWVLPILEELKNSSIKTKFYVDFNKAFQLYSEIIQTVKDGVTSFKTPILNRFKGKENIKTFRTAAKFGKPLDEKNSVFDRVNNKNVINPERVAALRALSEKYLDSEDSTITSVLLKSKKPMGIWKLSPNEKTDVIFDILQRLNIKTDKDTVERILNSKKGLNSFFENINDLIKFGFNLTNEVKNGTKKVTYEDLMKKTSENSDKENVIIEKLGKILPVIYNNSSGLQYEERVRYNDNTYFSSIAPFFLDKFISMTQRTVRLKSIKPLQDFLDNKYLYCDYFKADGKILNTWLRELYNGDVENENSLVSNLEYDRMLGSNNKAWNEFTPKNRITAFIQKYASLRQQSPKNIVHLTQEEFNKRLKNKEVDAQHSYYIENTDIAYTVKYDRLHDMYYSEKGVKNDYAYYPTFVTGDTGITRFIKARRYSENEIIDGLYDVFIQENKRMPLLSGINETLNSNGYTGIQSVDSHSNQFTLLTFLNNPEYKNRIDMNNLESSVKSLIKEYLVEESKSFIKNLDELGVLEKTGNKYKYLSQIVTEENPLESAMYDYFINSKFATIQQLQIMTVDPVFYKDTKTLQKRYKETSASGNSLDIFAIDPTTGERYSDGIETAVYFNDVVLNAEVTNPDFMEVIKSFHANADIIDAYKKNSLTDGQGYRTLESYKKVMGMNGNWSTEMEQAYQKILDIRSTIDKDTDISPEQREEIEQLSVVFQPIKPYLYTLENVMGMPVPVQHKDAEIVLIPELLPAGSRLRDLAYWMEEHVDKDGNKNPIDFVCSTEVVKVGCFGNVDFSKTSSREEMNEVLNNAYVHYLDYSDYRIQTNVPVHTYAMQGLGTQIKKLILSGLDMKKTYNYLDKLFNGKEVVVNLGGKTGPVHLNGLGLMRFYNSLIVANTMDSMDEYIKTVNDKEDILNRLTEQSMNNSRESKDNMFAFIPDEDGNPTMPLWEPGIEHDTSALLLSIYKKMVNKQKINGGSCVQASALGLTGYEESKSLQYICSEDKKNILYAECEMPFVFNYTDSDGNPVDLKFTDWCNPDGSIKKDEKGNPLIEKSYPGILDLVAYRIPTERDYSMLNLKIVRFSSHTAGGTIKVPVPATTIAGFDFDVDKLFFIRKEFKQDYNSKKAWDKFYSEHKDLYEELLALRKSDKGNGSLLSRLLQTEENDNLKLYEYKEGTLEMFNEWIKDRKREFGEFHNYDFNLSPLENTVTNRNNMILYLMQQRLMDAETLGERTTPGGFAEARKVARLMRELMFKKSSSKFSYSEFKESSKTSKDPEPNYDPSDVRTIVTFMEQNDIAGKLIGIFANHNTNHAIAKLLKNFTLKRPISFAGKSYSDLIHNSDVDTSLTLAEFLAASVDAVKDPVLNYMNFNTFTADAGAMLGRLGYTSEDIGLLFNQPIILDICKYSSNTGMVDFNKILVEVQKTYAAQEVENPGIDDFSKETLAKMINGFSNTEDKAALRQNVAFSKHQLKVAKLFGEILIDAKDVSDFLTNTKFTASNAVKSTFGGMITQQLKVREYINYISDIKKSNVNIEVSDYVHSPIDDDINLLRGQDYIDAIISNPFAPEQAAYDSNKNALNALKKYFPYHKALYTEIRRVMGILSSNSVLDAETIDDIHNELITFLLSKQEGSLFDGNAIAVDGLTNKEYFLNQFPIELFNTIENNPELQDNLLLKSLDIQEEDDGTYSILINNLSSYTPEVKDALKESWNDLLKTNKDLAISLFMYNYHKMGFSYGYKSFMDLAPIGVKMNIPVGTQDGKEIFYIDFLKNCNLDNPFLVSSDDFATQYIIDHSDNKSFVYTPKGTDKNLLKSIVYVDGKTVESFNIADLGQSRKNFIQHNEKRVSFYRAAINIDGNLYIARGEEDSLNQSSDGNLLYVRADKIIKDNYSEFKDDRKSEEGANNDESSTSLIAQTNNTVSRDILIGEIIEEIGKQEGAVISDPLIKHLTEASDTDLVDTVNEIRESNNNKEFYTLDENGNIIKQC